MSAIEKFFITYVIVLFFVVFMMGIGWTDVFSGYAGLEVPTPQPPTDSAFTDIFNTLGYFIENIAFFFTLMIVPTEVTWIIQLFFAPALVIIGYFIFTRLLIPLLQAIGSVIPFT